MEYFKHDINASEDEKICDLLAAGGYEFLGYYWRFIEYLYSRGGKANKNNLNGIAWSLHMDIDKLSLIICNFGLFYEDENYIYSSRVLKEVQEFEAVGKRMSEIGRSGGQASAQAKAKRTVEKNQADAQAYGKRAVERAVSECLTDSQAYGQQKKREKKKEKKIKENIIERMNEEGEAPSDFNQSFNQSCDDLKRKDFNGVFLSEEQLGTLLDLLSLEEVDYYMDRIRDTESKGKKYTSKTHFQAILDMAAEDRKR